MESLLTKQIKRKIHSYKPLIKTGMRTIRYADEVVTPTGVVDVIRFEDCYSEDETYCILTNPKNEKDLEYLNNLKDITIGYCKYEQPSNQFQFTPEQRQKGCHGCVFKRHIYKTSFTTTCFEIKISVSDFKSPNGHNFCGNRNYYVVTEDIYLDIKDLVPERIGIVSYDVKSDKLKMKKESQIIDIGDKQTSLLLYNAMKKWVDGKQVPDTIYDDFTCPICGDIVSVTKFDARDVQFWR